MKEVGLIILYSQTINKHKRPSNGKTGYQRFIFIFYKNCYNFLNYNLAN